METTVTGTSQLIFTPRVDQVLRLAQKEATSRKQNCIGPEHILMGIIKIEESCAFNVISKSLTGTCNTIDSLRNNLDKEIGSGQGANLNSAPLYTPRARKVLALSAKEAKEYSHQYIGTEDILLAIMAEQESIAFKVLKDFGLTYESILQCTVEELTGVKPETQPSTQKDPSTMNEADTRKLIEDSFSVLNMDFNNLPERLRKRTKELKLEALRILDEHRWFDRNLNHLHLLRELASESPPIWFDPELSSDTLSLVIAIFRGLGGNTIAELENAFGKTAPNSAPERRVGMVLQSVNHSPYLVKQIKINFLPTTTPKE